MNVHDTQRMVARNVTSMRKNYLLFNSTFPARQSLLSLHMTKSYVRTATRTTLKVEANLTQILNFKANFHTEFELFFKKKIMLTMVDTLRLSA